MRCLVFVFLVAAQIPLAGCAADPPPPYTLAFTAQGRIPRILHTAEETVVPLTVRNTGQNGWDASQTHVSYHWLWLVPREAAKRSRTVPFHDGIRTEIATVVPPGGNVHVDGRLLAPDYPGLYWLQWDMVKEGVTWFAQVSPREPRRLVLVLPSLAGLFAPLPLIVALVSIFGLGAGARSSTLIAMLAVADVIWCAAALLAKPLILIREALLEPTSVAYWLTLAAAMMFRDRAVMEKVGPLGYHVYDAWTYGRTTFFRPPASAEQIDEARRWFAERAPQRAGVGPSFGLAAGKNLIAIQVESLQDFMVGYRIAGQAVMPHLQQWSRDGLRLTNVTDQTGEGRTSDAEFTALTSLLPLDHGAVAFRYPGSRYVGLPRVLTEHGYATLSAVAFEAGFWNRRVTHPSYGFQESLFERDFQLTEQIGWGLNDHDFLQQMVARLERLPRPFAAWLITLSLHYPFEGFPDAHKVLSLGALERTPFGNYLHAMRFFDTALGDFEASLARAGLLDDTMLIVFGDHDAGFARNNALSAAIGIPADDASWELNDRVPFVIKWPRRASPHPTGSLPIAAGQTDFAPTLLALVGIDPSRLPYMGRNLLGQPADVPIVRPCGDWLDRAHVFISRSAAERGDQCDRTSPAIGVDPSLCRSANALAARTRDIARLVVTDQLQERLREALR